MSRVFVGDFETSVYKGQTHTEVWASACVEMYTEQVLIFHSIDEQFQYFDSLKQNIVVYYHNLKFDGNFWLWFFLKQKQYKQAYIKLTEDASQVKWMTNRDMPSHSIKYSISDRGMWYTITVKTANNIIEFRDSYKLLPFSLKKIGEDFKTKHQKLDMEYTGFRYAGCNITDEEKAYISNDVLVIKEALEFMFEDGHNKLTIGSCCLAEFKKTFLMGVDEYNALMPDLTVMHDVPNNEKSADAWIRHSYKGGWCYLVPEKANKIFFSGVTADVNSLYPSMMHSESGNYYPIGKPRFWTGNYIPDCLKLRDASKYFFFVRIRCRFYLKKGKLPFVQIKGSHLYKGTESLRASDVYNEKTGLYSRWYKDANGNIRDSCVELTLTMIDYALLIDHYELVDMVILSGCYFRTQIGIFDDYIDKYKKIKQESTGAKRQSAKLFLNNLYGKMATNQDSSFKVAYLKDDDSIGFYSVEEHDKKAGYIPIGSAITSYARNFTIRHAQKNYHGVNKRGFIYADTDSIHCDLSPDELRDITIHASNFCAWKLESSWDTGIFVRQKTYIEHITHHYLEKVESPYYDVKCAGMPDACKNLFVHSMLQDISKNELEQLDDESKKFIEKVRTINDFKIGLKVPKKLMPKRISGGVLLVETTYEMR